MENTIHQDLRQFCGSQQFYRHWLCHSLLFTEGVHYLAEHAGAFWLIDAIASYQSKIQKKDWASFQVWHLTPDGKGGAYLTCHADMDDLPVDLKGRIDKLTKTEKPEVLQHIEYTNFPFEGDESFHLWVEQSGEKQFMLLLPSEH